MRLSDYSISSRLTAAFMLVASLGGLLGIFAVYNMGQLDAADTALYERDTLGLSLAKEANVQRYVGVVALRDAILATTVAERAQALERMQQWRAKSIDLIEQARQKAMDGPTTEAIRKVEQAWAADEQSVQEMLKQLQTAELHANSPILQYLHRHAMPRSMQVGQSMFELTEHFERNAKQVSDNNTVLYERSRNITLALAALCVLLGIALGVLISRSVTAPLAQAVAAVRSMSTGDMRMALHPQGQDEVAHMLHALEQMRQQLQAIVVQVRQGSGAVASASTQIAQGNQDLSARTESQASALEQTAASMEELSATVRHNADNTQQANQLVQSAATVATQGGQAVTEVVSTMKDISDASRRMADIIGVIDGIAFQTNILALNAAVEAARAGEQGRGFAVVASEVRHLAQRSATAAKEIKALITENIDRVGQGNTLAERAGHTIDEVVTHIYRVKGLMGEISTATTEQSTGMAQIGEAVVQMDQATQQNAALVEEMAAAADSLRLQAQDLVHAVAVFQTDPSDAAPFTESVSQPTRLPV
ncbi:MULTISPECIES: methyl-accepting chemotaxis protein [Giesbergeria]|uniref:methyl-accepting chemotaxis protein n=1 Tax=Giesbergeria sinuosa TaxID=80883 RepID=UPI003A8D8994